MTYTAERPPIATASDELRARIPGWGVDLNPAVRPAVPRERFDPKATGAHWDFPERQPEKWPRERSIEHQTLTPVFGTSCPPRGASGAVRKLAYRRFGEGRAAHWLLLIAADRVDALEHHVASMFTAHPDNPITETGIVAEFTHHGFASRYGKKRVDVAHHWLDPVIVAGPWLVAGALLVSGIKGLRRVVSGQEGWHGAVGERTAATVRVRVGRPAFTGRSGVR